MPTTKHTVSVRLDGPAVQRLERAARLVKQSRGAFLEKAGDEAARRVLLDEATRRYRRGEGSFSELAAETGLAVEEIMDAVGHEARDQALDMFLASCRTMSAANNDPEFLRLAQQAAAAVRSST